VHQISKRGAIDPVFLWRLWRFLRNGHFQVVHAFSITAELWVRLLVPWVRGVRMVSSVRGLGLNGPDWHWRAKRWIVNGSAAVISNTRAGAELVARRCGVSVQGISVVPNGLDLPPPPQAAQRQQARKTLGLEDSAKILLFVGRLVAEKNLGLLLQALVRLPEDRRPLVLLAGDGPERIGLKAEADRLGLGETLCFLGERSDISTLMQAADVLVLPSREEGLSNVLLEAMGSGLPVVATAVGGSPELIENDQTGLLVPSNDAGALVQALSVLFSDEDLRVRLGAAARKHAEQRFALAAMVAGTSRIYDDCLAAKVANA